MFTLDFNIKYVRLYRYLLPFWRKGILILFLSSLGMALGLINPFLAKLMIDKAYANKDLRLFLILISIGGIIFILSSIGNSATDYLSRYIRMRINLDLNQKVFRKLQDLPYGYFQEKSTGEHLYKINYDIEQVTRLICDMSPQIAFLPFKSIFIFAIVLYLNWRVALLALLLSPFLYLSAYYFNKRLKNALKIWIELSQNIFKQLQEVLTHIHLIKAFGKEGFQKRRYIRSLMEKIRLGLKNTRLEVTSSFVNSFINRIISGLIICYGGFQLIKGQMTLGSLSAITIYISQLSGLQNSFTRLFQQINSGIVSCERLWLILDASSQVAEGRRAKEIVFPRGKIEFRNVTFGYNQSRTVLENLSFCIEGASRIALVGPSGCGKTTIINLILRLYKLRNGGIFIDECDIEDIKSKLFCEQIGVALQESYLWNDSIRNNILYGDDKAGNDKIATAAEIAQANDFIMKLPRGYETVIGERACKISEGQRQRIAIARAVIKGPKILILDEAMSSVDSETEDRITDNIRREFKDSTIIVVSHRLSTVKKMDLVYFLEDSNRLDIGRHEELLTRNSGYVKLFLSQIEQEQLKAESPYG